MYVFVVGDYVCKHVGFVLRFLLKSEDQPFFSSNRQTPQSNCVPNSVQDGTGRREIGRDMFSSANNPVINDVYKEFGNEAKDTNDVGRNRMLAASKSDKKQAKNSANQRVRKLMVEKAMDIELSYKNGTFVSEFSDLQAIWREDIGKAHLVWEICFGHFDNSPGWAKVIEIEVMKEREWKYKEPKKGEEHMIGCVERVVSCAKSEQVKNVMKGSLLTHKKTIRMSRNGDDINDLNRFDKREKGVFKNEYVVDHNVSIHVQPCFRCFPHCHTNFFY